MRQVPLYEVKNRLSRYLRLAEKEEIIITRHGKKVAKMIRPHTENNLPNLNNFRSSIKIDGKPMSQEVIDARREERY